MGQAHGIFLSLGVAVVGAEREPPQDGPVASFLSREEEQFKLHSRHSASGIRPSAAALQPYTASAQARCITAVLEEAVA